MNCYLVIETTFDHEVNHLHLLLKVWYVFDVKQVDHGVIQIRLLYRHELISNFEIVRVKKQLTVHRLLCHQMLQM